MTGTRHKHFKIYTEKSLKNSSYRGDKNVIPEERSGKLQRSLKAT
jgi:hypothetical protein